LARASTPREVVVKISGKVLKFENVFKSGVKRRASCGHLLLIVSSRWTELPASPLLVLLSWH
jgi:hypothetical protein